MARARRPAGTDIEDRLRAPTEAWIPDPPPDYDALGYESVAELYGERIALSAGARGKTPEDRTARLRRAVGSRRRQAAIKDWADQQRISVAEARARLGLHPLQ